jgi:triosephosphate isomerase
MRTPLIAGNWKLNKTIAEAEALLAELVPLLDALQSVETLVCPPFVSLSAAAAALRGSRVRLGAQNLYWEDSGAFTGEVSAPMLAGLCQYVIIGHSERRAYFGETDESVNQKARAALAHGLTPIVCVGEVLAEREAGREAGVVGGQLHAGLAGLPVTSSEHLVIAYEPVWAIGTGKAATVEDAVAMNRDVIRPALAGLFSDELAQAIRIQYGGSVKPGNAAEYFAEDEVDGALVGGASLNAADFSAIAAAAA